MTDDCISPGYHASLPMEVHGSCYSNMQIISKSSYNTLKCPGVVITQNSFDLETFTFYVANFLCTSNAKKYGILYDSAYEILHVSYEDSNYSKYSKF
jgi:DDB1- and CUL4-associated factor 15